MQGGNQKLQVIPIVTPANAGVYLQLLRVSSALRKKNPKLHNYHSVLWDGLPALVLFDVSGEFVPIFGTLS